MEPAVKSKTWARNRLIRDGIYQAVYEQMKVDRSVYLFGEGSHMKVHFDAPYIEKEFPNRIVTLPISEDGNSNFAVGTSLVGIKPIVDVISSDFLFRTMDSICVPPDTIVLGDNKQISEYRTGNACLGRSGRIAVESTTKRQYAGTMIEIKAAGLLPFRITPEHPVMVATGSCLARTGWKTELSPPDWKAAKSVVPKLANSSGDYLIVPRFMGDLEDPSIDLRPYIAGQHGNRNQDIVSCIPLNTDTSWLIGLYVAEGFVGCTRPRRTIQYKVMLSVGRHERGLLEKARDIAASIGIHGNILETRTACVLELYSVPLARYLMENCGKGALNKKIPDTVLMHKDSRILKAFLDGYWVGDGCVVADRRVGHSPVVSFETVSLVLAQQLQLAFARLGVLAGVCRQTKGKGTIQGRRVNQHDLYHIRFARTNNPSLVNRNGVKIFSDYIAVPIRRVTTTDYTGTVCNLRTSDNTYLVSNSVVHNCNTAAKLNHVSADIDKPKTIVIRSEFFLGGPCLLPKSRVWYNPRPEMVGTSSDNRIYGGNGNSEDIREESWQAYRGDAYTIKPHCLQSMKVTEEHPFYIARIKTHSDSRSHYPYTHKQKKIVWEGWTRAKDLKSGDYLVVPKLIDRGKREFIKLRPKTYSGGGAVDRELEINETIAAFLGWYVAEGSFKDNGEIILTLNKNSDPVDEIRTIISSMGYSTYKSAHGENSINLGFRSRMLVPWLRQHIGKGAKSKRIPVEIFQSPNDIKLIFLKAYFQGDGNIAGDNVGAKTASEDLFYDLTYLLLSLGIIPSTSEDIDRGHILDGKLIKGGKSYRIRVCGKQRQLLAPVKVKNGSSQQFVEQEHRYLVPIKKISKFHYEGPIYNVVTEDHTYLAPVVTHNTTGQRLESLFTHIPGLNVVLPSNPRDARGLMKTALSNPGITLFFEDRMINDSDTKESDKDTGVTESIPFGKAKVRRTGKRLTIVSYALALKEVEAVAENHGVDCDLIDPRTLYPLDFDTICDSVAKTGRLLIVEPDVTYAGIGAEIAASVVERSFSALKRPIRRLGAPRTVIPASQGLHKYVMPSRDEILGEIRELSN